MNPLPCPSCGQELAESGMCSRCFGETMDRQTAVPVISAYKMVRLIGRGGMGSVYLAEDHALNRRVAIKIISEKLAQEDYGRNRFLREARALESIEHPNVVHFYSVGEFSHQPYIVMEYVEGETLAERIKREGGLPLEEALRILREAVEGLNAAAQKHVVHRDIKPSNILLDKKGRVCVADFGLAKPLQIETESTFTQSGSIIGSPHYISPEQAQGKGADFRSDIYAMGIVFYEMLVGERPFEDTTPLAIVLKHLNSPMPSPREKRHELPESIVRLLQWMTRKEPDKRPSSYSQLLERIDSILEKKKPAFSKSKTLLFTGIILLMVTMAISVWFHQTPISAPKVPQRSHPFLAPTNLSSVTINVLPWARVNIIPLTKDIVLPAIPQKERITPCNFVLPEGEFAIELLNDSGTTPVQQKIRVQSGKVNSFLFTMPGYDPAKALAKIRGKL